MARRPAPEPAMYRCTTCGRLTRSHAAASRHLTTHHGGSGGIALVLDQETPR